MPRNLPHPEGIVVLSAHWQTRGTRVTWPASRSFR
jgi:aromatic ring-opening dioxygenase catalytic subunit (LigB family)